MNYNAITALLLFVGISLLLFFIFMPKKGIYFLLKNMYQQKDKTIIEDILKFMYHNQRYNNSITTNQLTSALSFSNSKIIDSLKRMLVNELISLEKDSYKLTANGNEYALQVIRAHRLWEKYLSEKTGYNKEEWHERAEKKEHELSKYEINKLSNLLGHPKFDPHGDPIPTRKGKLVNTKGIPLSTLKEGEVGEIINIEDKPDIIYKQILAEQIYLHSTIRVIENGPARIAFHSEGEEFVLAPIIARNIIVSVLKDSEIKEDNIARLSSLKLDEKAIIFGLSNESRGESRRRLLDLGFVKGATVSIDLLNPLGDPTAFSIKGTSIALRKEQSSKILINKISNEK